MGLSATHLLLLLVVVVLLFGRNKISDLMGDVARGIAGAELVVVPDAAHSPQLESPDAWRAAVLAHLARARRAGAEPSR